MDIRSCPHERGPREPPFSKIPAAGERIHPEDLPLVFEAFDWQHGDDLWSIPLAVTGPAGGIT